LFNSTYFNITAWNAAAASVETVSIDMQRPQPAINIIEDICTSIFGLLLVDPDGKYSFKIVDTAVSASTTIKATDIRSPHRIPYNPAEVISSARIGYAKDWITTGTAFTYYTDDSQEDAVFLKYKTYNEKTFDTYLDNLTAATAYASTVMAYHKDIHGRMEVEVPMAYYDITIGDIVDAEIERRTQTMIGTTKSEIISVRYVLDKPAIMLGLRFV
jgi:hypothetical protein